MKTVLILTVGGSHQPLLTSIAQHRPDLVVFLCSGDAGKVQGSYTQVTGEGKILRSKPDLEKPDLPNIVILAGLKPEQFRVHLISRFDDLNECYLESLAQIEKTRAESPDARILVDYTGGTKSMTAGLTAAALDDGQCDISLVAGRRPDLVKVQDQTEFVRPVQVWDAQAMRRLRAARELLSRYDYAAAEKLLRVAAARFASDRTLAALQRGIVLCRAFDAWDKFDHALARQLLEPYRKEFVPQWQFLGCLASQTHGFEWVEDLLQNAARRFVQHRFDDAVGRIYRAIELTAQVWLQQQHNLITGNVDLAAIPETLQAKVERCREGGQENGRIKIGLLLAWDVVAAFQDDPLGQLFASRRGEVLSFLGVRNASLFAHGVSPITRDDYDQRVPAIATFLNDALATAIQARKLKRPVVLEQLPTQFLDQAF